jgi:hypothetical protein
VLTFVLPKNSIEGQSAGVVYTIAGFDAITVGRSRKADVQIKSPNLSRTHLKFVPSSEGWSIEDMGSRNGIKLNGTLVKEVKLLREGDCVQAGDCFFEIVGVSTPVEGPKQIEIAHLDNQDSTEPIPEVNVSKGSAAGFLMKLVDTPVEIKKPRSEPAPTKNDLPPKRTAPPKRNRAVIDEDDALLLGHPSPVPEPPPADPIDDDAILLAPSDDDEKLAMPDSTDKADNMLEATAPLPTASFGGQTDMLEATVPIDNMQSSAPVDDDDEDDFLKELEELLSEDD